jgi:hypothetical protein
VSPIIASEIETRLTGGAGNANPNLSLGGVISSTAFVTAVQNNLFDDVPGVESSSAVATDRTEYRGFAVRNSNASLTFIGPVIWIDTLTTSADTEFDLAVAAEGVNVTMATIANEKTAPATVTFTRPTSKATGLALSDIPNGQFRGVWIRRTVTQNAAAVNDSGSFRVEGDTAA